MTAGDYGIALSFGTFITPLAADPPGTVAMAVASERAGFDLVTFQDHPYQPAFLDTWTLLSWVGACTERVQLAGNVHNLPLRPPAVLARSAASLDRLTNGRMALGLGTGGFWDAIVAMGADRRTPAEAVLALSEAIGVIREIWDTDTRGGIFRDGQFYRLDGATRGPAPAHPIPLWLGAYGPRMLDLVGCAADGWLPSLGRLDGTAQLGEGNARIDAAADAAGREPSSIRRLLNVGSADAEPEQLAELALEYGMDTFIVSVDDPGVLARIGDTVLPETRALVAAERG
ncbi:LLM class flavin-dependent oxidoreductase [Cryobacterium sp. SO2]|uniref:LLM class flavin-dependent oxidoreductase n=1 Tax=Cryobacterium sp. SO2 TaxID=1897060 RepID=UPI0031F5A91F